MISVAPCSLTSHRPRIGGTSVPGRAGRQSTKIKSGTNRPRSCAFAPQTVPNAEISTHFYKSTRKSVRLPHEKYESTSKSPTLALILTWTFITPSYLHITLIKTAKYRRPHVSIRSHKLLRRGGPSSSGGSPLRADGSLQS
jgi:hypothetical protein